MRILDLNLYHRNEFFPLDRDLDFPSVFKKDTQLFWRFRPSRTIDSRQYSDISYHINTAGLRGSDFDPHKSRYRILALGNSCTFGWGVRYQYIWTTRLQEILDRQSPGKYEVINAGVPGYSSFQGKAFFENELYELQPDMVLIMFGWNDQWKAGLGISDAEQKPPSRIILSVQNLLSSLELYQLARKLVLSSTDKPSTVMLYETQGRRRVSPSEFLVNLRSIISFAKAHHARPVLMIPPIPALKTYFPGLISPFHDLHQQYEDEIVAASKYEQVPLVDLQSAFDKYNDLFNNPSNDPIHFNAKGHQVAAEEIAATILPILEQNPLAHK
ncbi:MAG TPA: GDSL-type esterase/lipase family protein [candidate division Zixibacteria bacterium]|nr:GDSL-type esterase/lipase family protein [candidate division Zixibacteria bacterium]